MALRIYYCCSNLLVEVVCLNVLRKEVGKMKSSLIIILMITAAFVLAPVMVYAQTDQAAATPPLSQPLVREGTLATKLADVLKVGPATNEAEAESALTAVGIAPKNGWIADYPVTPDITGELQTSIIDAATAGGITLGKDDAVKAFNDVMNEYNLPVAPGISTVAASNATAPAYPESDVANNYYYDEGPPVVTYYAPPPDYAYLYTWVPYPFWWWDFWFPGFFVLADFDGHGHHHGHDGHHDGHHDGRGHEGKEFVSNHFRDPSTGTMSRVDPATRASGGTLTGGHRGWNNASAQSSAQSIVTNRRTFAPRTNSPAVSSSTNGMYATTPHSQTSVSSGGRNSVAPASGSHRISNYNNRSFNQSTYRAPRVASSSGQSRSFSQPAYRTSGNFSSSVGNRSYSMPSAGSRFSGSSISAQSLGGRSFSAPSVGSGFSGGSFSGMRGFGGGARTGGSFGGFRR